MQGFVVGVFFFLQEADGPLGFDVGDVREGGGVCPALAFAEERVAGAEVGGAFDEDGGFRVEGVVAHCGWW